ncbi:cell division suppressor protein YneA [Lysinibacillus sp. 54212]|uniref:cell division suppressor protein YneA n=1 Tax=Lysinibacillus sp. 54212 TaxID=3119829 RepID=UPI002FCA6642
MKWLKQNSYIALFFAASLVFILYLFITDEKIEHYKNITIEQGDTLWSLADQYRGKMSTHDWITFVKKENAMKTGAIVEGQEILIPVERHSIYIANLIKEDHYSVKVASEQQ